MDFVTLNNGVKMPLIGFGTYQMSAGITERCVADALKIGYRHVDTAQCYGNEREVGLAIKNSRADGRFQRNLSRNGDEISRRKS